MDSKMKLRIAAMPIAIAALGAPFFAGGCSELEDAQAAVCCTEFQVGGTVKAEVSGTAQGQVAAQAVADFSGIASAAVDDLTAACRSMAQDLDAPKADQDAAEKNEDKVTRLNAWCSLATSAIASFKASAMATLTIDFVPPACEASISAKADCQAKCSASGSCDIKATPPTCEGGTLEIACKGSCTAMAGASVKCEGSCEGNCEGSCSAMGGVECAGRCEGTCTASGGANTGPQADGTCKGTCTGTCEVTAPGVTCNGSCKGSCDAACKGTAEASVKCDGTCDADYEPIKCTGGTLKGGCEVEAKCDASCDASVSAKAKCTPPQVRVAFSGAANVEAAAKLQATFEANLGVVLALQARADALVTLVANVDVEGFADIKASCLIPLGAAVIDAGGQLEAVVSATASVGGEATGS